MKTKASSPAISFVMFGITATTLASAVVDWQPPPNQYGNRRLSWAADGGLQAHSLKAGERAAIPQTASSLPRPGVYKTEPYACTVVVTDKCPDDRSVAMPAERGSVMPMIKPELSFSPLHSK